MPPRAGRKRGEEPAENRRSRTAGRVPAGVPFVRQRSSDPSGLSCQNQARPPKKPSPEEWPVTRRVPSGVPSVSQSESFPSVSDVDRK